MDKKILQAVFFLFLTSILTAQASGPKGPYLGQKPPGKVPQIFAPGFISDKNVVGCTFSPDGQEFYFSRFISQSNRIMVTINTEFGWTEPVLVEFNKDFFGGPPFISPDGARFIWRAVRPFPANWPGVKPKPGSREELVYWNMRKTETGWINPEPFLLPVPDNSRLHGISMTLDGTVYTCFSNVIVRILYQGQEFLEPEIVLKGYPGAYPAVAPDENFLVFTKQGNPRQLMVIFKNEDKSWSEPMSLDTKINQKGMNGYPYISYDGKYLFYTRNHKIYWVSTEAIKALRDVSFVPQRFHRIRPGCFPCLDENCY